MRFDLHHGDCLAVLRTLPDCSVDAVVTDPPYGLSFMGKKWDYDVPGEAIWRECLRVLKPGGHLLAFAGTRTQHRMAVRIEDAGFEIRDMIAWVYGSGFPKSMDISKQLDRMAGAEREVVGYRKNINRTVKRGDAGAFHSSEGGMFREDRDIFADTAPATDAARQWDGWGTALKPALEPITVARKPLAGTVAANVLQWGTGGINVDGCRVGTSKAVPASVSKSKTREIYGDYAGTETPGVGGHDPNTGRWPANLIHDGSDEVVGLFPGEGDKSAARFMYCAKASKADRDEGLEGFDIIIHSSRSNDGELWDQEESLAQLRVVMGNSRPKVIAASGALNRSVIEWNTLLFGNEKTGLSQQNMTFITETGTSSTTESKILSCFLNLLTSESMAAANFGTVFGGSRVESVEHGIQQITITNVKTESALGVERAAFKTQLRISVRETRNNHVTVKPTDLMRYLCRLVTPPGGTVLDPFMGSGSTGKAALLEGFSFIGIEREAEYIEIARARIESAQSQPKQTDLF